MENRIRGEAAADGTSKQGEVSTARAMERRVTDVTLASMESASKNRDSNGELNSGRVSGEEQVIRWERFLPQRVLRVLLVENDDSTRHIVAALLRKCSYQVAAVADGLKAWEVLKEKHYNFDIVLTEVVMPSLSGIGLLSKIMSNEICKNIPVIMMSSHDSMGVVFKCMLKGAADFLVKPVRKNELRNLWQHVWRKYCSSNCGNGSENGEPNQTRLEVVYDNEAAGKHENADAGHNSKTGDSSDGKRSDTQSSCSKLVTEIESVWKQGEPLENEYRSFHKETDSKLEKHDSKMAEVETSSVHEKGKTKDKSTEIEIKVTLSINEAVSTEKVLEENGFYDGFPCREEDPVSIRSKECGNIDSELLDQNVEINEPSKEIFDFIGTATTERCNYPVLEHNDHWQDSLCELAKSSDARGNTCNSGSSPLWELSLRRPQLEGRDEEAFQEKHILNHSDASAFSRYGNARIRLPCPRSGSSSANLCLRTNECGSSTADHGNEAPIYCQISSASNKEDAGVLSSVPSRENMCVGHSSTGRTVFPPPQLGVIPLHIPVRAIPFQNLCASYGAVLQPVFYPELSVSFPGSAEVEKEIEEIPSNPSTHNCNHLIKNPQHLNCHHFVENPRPHQMNQGMEEQRADIEPTDPIVMVHTPAEKANQSGSCSRGITIVSGSNGSYEETSVAVNAGSVLESGNEDGFQDCNGQGYGCDRSRREAALTKFRLKRKDRCFEKKVRYHSRKKLAEQRPRLKGQFVRQAVVAESTTIAAESED